MHANTWCRLTMREMSENEISESVRKYLIREYSQRGTIVWHFEATDTDGDRPDLLLFIEYQSPRRQWVTHSIESKRARRYVTVSDRRRTCLGVHQARKYYANYRWLAISKDLFHELTDEEWQKLISDCRRSFQRVGLLVTYKTRVDEYIEARYHPGSWIEYYKAQNWILEQISE